MTVAALTVLLVGCGRSPVAVPKLDLNEARIAALEARCANLESNYEALHQSTTNSILGVLDLVRTNADSRKDFDLQFANMVLMQGGQLDAIQAVLSNYFGQGARRVQPPTATAQATRTGAGAAGVPQSVYSAIVADAERDWPGNYEMQQYRIRTQVEAYKSLHPQ